MAGMKTDNWRRESDKEVAQLSEQHTCELCGSAVEVVSSGEGTNSYRPVESERMAKLEAEHLWAKRLINCWWTAELPQYNDVANPEGFEKLEGKTAVAIERWKEATKAAEDALTTPSAAAERVRAVIEAVGEWRREALAYHSGKQTDSWKVLEALDHVAKTHAALDALDAATVKETLTVEEAKGE